MRRQRGAQGRRGGRKGRVDGVADALEDVSTIGDDGVPQDGVVAGERVGHRGLVAIPEAGAALDVGEEKRDSPRW